MNCRDKVIFIFISSQYAKAIETRNTAWDHFLTKVGGVSSLSFNLTRQSGNRWKIFNVTQKDRNREELRHLIHQGVCFYIYIYNYYNCYDH